MTPKISNGGEVCLIARRNIQLWIWLRIVISCTLIVLLFSYIDYADVLAVLDRAILWPILVSGLIALGGRLLVAYRWHILVRTASSEVGFGKLLRVVFVSGFLGFFMPGAVGVELVRVYVLARLTHVTLAFSSVLVERLTALLALVGIVLLGLLVAPVGLPDAIGTYAVPTAALLCLAVLSLLANRVRALYLALLTGPMLAPLRSRLVAFYRQIDAFRQTPSLMTQLAALSIGLQLLRVLEGVALAVALGVDVELAYLFVIIPAGVLVTMLPISLGGLGVREALYVALFGAIGVDAASAFTLSFVNFLVGVIVLLMPGAILYAFGGLALNQGT
jgi:glycosyltransferase 2 family protein